MGTLCLAGGITGFARTRSIPSLVAGVRSGQERLQEKLWLLYSFLALVSCISGALTVFGRELLMAWRVLWVCLQCQTIFSCCMLIYTLLSCLSNSFPLLCPALSQGSCSFDTHLDLCTRRSILRQDCLRTQALNNFSCSVYVYVRAL